MTVINGDCIDIIPDLGNFDFIFADPPFNIGQKYQGFVDKISDYEHFTYQWISACWKVCNGILCLHGNDDLANLYLSNADLLDMPRIAWVNWYYRFGQCNRNNWVDSRCHCLIYSKSDNYTWNPDSVLVDSDRVKYKDKRINDTDNGGKRLPGTVWGVNEPNFGRIQGNNKERRSNHPNQLPEKYLERLILAYTNEGDRVLDPFGGSGTTAVVAQSLNRNFVTIDISKENCQSIEDRLDKGTVRV